MEGGDGIATAERRKVEKGVSDLEPPFGTYLVTPIECTVLALKV